SSNRPTCRTSARGPLFRDYYLCLAELTASCNSDRVLTTGPKDFLRDIHVRQLTPNRWSKNCGVPIIIFKSLVGIARKPATTRLLPITIFGVSTTHLTSIKSNGSGLGRWKTFNISKL